jgi:hypothetical protein
VIFDRWSIELVKNATDDFRYAEKQVEGYINQFNQEFDNLLRDREAMEEKVVGNAYPTINSRFI